MLHPSIAAGRWLSGISDLTQLTNDENVVNILSREWERVMRHDFHPVLAPALQAVYAVETAGKRGWTRPSAARRLRRSRGHCPRLRRPRRRPRRPAVQQG